MTFPHPPAIRADIVSLGEEWADRDAAASLLEETRKSILADIINRTPGSSYAARESVALADPEYRQHLTSMVECRRLANRARVAHDASKIEADMMRSAEATRRAEINLR